MRVLNQSSQNMSCIQFRSCRKNKKLQKCLTFLRYNFAFPNLLQIIVSCLFFNIHLLFMTFKNRLVYDFIQFPSDHWDQPFSSHQLIDCIVLIDCSTLNLHDWPHAHMVNLPRGRHGWYPHTRRIFLQLAPKQCRLSKE